MKTVVLLMLLCWPLAGTAAEAREFRAFAVAYKHELSRSESYASFRAAIRGQFEQDIAPHLRSDVPNLVSYPENQTLMAYLVGLRGAAGRQLLDEAGAIPALASLAGPYAPQIAYYQARYPGTSAPGQLLQLGLTDTLARLVMETFAPLADEYDIYLSVSSNLAPFERIEGGEAALLADPQGDTSYAYRATAPQIYNRNFIFGPGGELLTIQDKAYLVPLERDQGAGLGLTGIETWQLPVFELPFAHIGTAISKDAWMPDVNTRLDQLGAELLIQPEAFSSWGAGGEDLWPPDKFQRGGWWMVQQHPTLQINVTPMLTGNLGDQSFDGQPLIAVEAGPAQRCLMGQQAEAGWAAVGIWSDYDDPRALCDPARRAELQEQALALKPGSGDARENVYADDVVFADLRLPARPPAAARVPARGFASQALGGSGAQLMPRLSRAGGSVWLGWIDSFGEPRQSVAVSRWQAAGGWGPPLDLGSAATAFDHFDNQWSPAPLARDDGALVLAWTAFATENWDLFAGRIDVGAAPVVAGQTRLDDAESGTGVTRERGHSAPRLTALPDGRILAVWSDLRWPWIKPQIRYAVSEDGGASWSASRRADAGPLEYEDAQLDARDPGETRGQAFPDVLALDGGRLLFVWQEAGADGRPGIELTTVDADGRVLRRQRIAGDRGYRPRLAGGAARQWLIYEARDAVGGLRLWWRTRPRAGEWSAARPLDPSASAGHRQRHAQPLVNGGELHVVYEDDRAGDSDILLIRAGQARPVRVDDAPAGRDAHAPAAVTLPGGKLLLAWQDETPDRPTLRWSVQPLADAQRGGAVAWSTWLVLLAWLALRRARLHFRTRGVCCAQMPRD